MVKIIVGRQARRCGLIGAITSVGGVFTLPFGLTIDLFTTARIQNEMLYFIASVYQPPGVDMEALDIREALGLRLNATGQAMVVEGGQRLSRYAIRELTVLLVEKTIAKVIPGLGLMIGFLVNYLTTQAMGRLVALWYERQAAVSH